MQGSDGGGRVVGVSLKMYFRPHQEQAWMRAAAEAVRETPDVHRLEVFFVPSFLSLAAGREILAGTSVRFGAQDVFWKDYGPYTGEVSAPMLQDTGCSYVEVGHAERRRLFGEDDEITARKAAATVRAGLVPVVCVGESGKGTVDEAVRDTSAQIRHVLTAVPDQAELIFAYEPVWAIGAAAPAGAERIVATADGLRRAFEHRSGRTRLIYGGSAGPGLFARLSHGVDGLFLGRFAHDIGNFRAVLAEMTAGHGGSGGVRTAVKEGT